MTNFYVYYRFDPERADFFRNAVNELFKSMEAATGVRGRWLRRRDDASTYMEVYEGVEDDRAFEVLLEREAAKLGLERRVERFVCA